MTGKYQAYPEYKDCLFPLIKQIPNNWSEQKVKFQLSGCVAGGTPESGNELFWTDSGDGTAWVSIADMTRSTLITRTEKDVTDRGIYSKGLKIVPKGSLLYSIFASLGKVSEAGVDLTTNQAILALIQKETLNKAFFRYWLQNMERYLMYYSTSNTQNNLNSEKVGNLPIFIPSHFEQVNIGRFLDHETAKIDTLIDKQQQLIQLLKEKRQAVISHAVTKGLNPNVPMRDSGVEWLGEVPEHWSFPKVKWFFKTESGGTPNTSRYEEYYQDGDIPWIRSTDLNNNELFETPIAITSKAIRESACTVIPTNSVLIAMYGGAGTIGKHTLLKFESAINQAVCAILPTNKINPDFLHLYVEFYRPYWMVGAEGARKDPNINQETIRELVVSSPPYDEQVEIVKVIQQKIAVIDQTVSKCEKNIQLMQERRTALISAAVTGKIDVRHPVCHPTGDLQSSKSTVHGDL